MSSWRRRLEAFVDTPTPLHPDLADKPMPADHSSSYPNSSCSPMKGGIRVAHHTNTGLLWPWLLCLGATLSGCLGLSPSNPTSQGPPLVGFEALYTLPDSTGTLHEYSVRVLGRDDVFGIQMEHWPCIRVEFHDHFHDERSSICYSAETFEPIEGYMRHSSVDVANSDYDVGPGFYQEAQMFGLGLGLTGHSWTAGQSRLIEWYGVPMEWQVTRIDGDRIHVRTSTPRYDPSNGTLFDHAELRAVLRTDLPVPEYIGYDWTDPHGWEYAGGFRDLGPLPTLPPADWTSVQRRLVPYEYPWPTGSGCPAGVLTPQEALAYELERNEELAALKGPKLSALAVRITNTTEFVTEVKVTMTIQSADSNVTFAVRQTTVDGLPPMLNGVTPHWTYDANVYHEPFPLTVVPYCALWEMAWRMHPEANGFTINLRGLEPWKGVPYIQPQMGLALIQNTTWGTSSVGVIVQVALPGQICYFGGTSALVGTRCFE